MKLYVLVLVASCFCPSNYGYLTNQDVGTLVPTTSVSGVISSCKPYAKVEFTTDLDVVQEKMIAGYRGWEIGFYRGRFRVVEMKAEPLPQKWSIIVSSEPIVMEARP